MVPVDDVFQVFQVMVAADASVATLPSAKEQSPASKIFRTNSSYDWFF